jgi:outer membrane receptor protein involved in Fe transport
MRRPRALLKALLVSTPLSLPLCISAGLADDAKPPGETNAVYVNKNVTGEPDGEIVQAQVGTGDVVTPLQPLRSAELPIDFRSTNIDLITPERAPTGPAANVIAGSEASIRSTSDAGSLLGKSLSSTGVESQRRNPVSFEPRIRGHKVGQLNTSVDGAYWFPARQDLDTMLSKIDASVIRDIIVLKGPYSVRYGPGFSFIDIETIGTPRYDAYEWHGRTSLNYQTNGEQWYGRQALSGGASDWGYRIGYGHRTGSDYDTGDDTEIPSSYKVRDIDTAFGYDLSENSSIEFGYLRLDQTDTEFPGQIFDIDFLVTDGYTLRYKLENQCYFDQFTIDTWYNRTRLEGDSANSSKRRQIPLLDLIGFSGRTDIDEMSTGFRAALRWGEAECGQLTVGADLSYLEIELNEIDVVFAGSSPFNFPIPRSHSSDPGFFVDYSAPMGDRLSIKAGARMDVVSTNAEGRVDRDSNGVIDTGFGRLGDDDIRSALDSGLSQHFTLWAAYITGEYTVNDNWTASFGFGHAERPPTLTELYSLDPFLAILQQGTVFVYGDPQLDEERLWQIDLGLKADYCNWRGGINGFYSWIRDYITYVSPTADPSAAAFQEFDFVNTELATLSGGEIYAEYDWNEWITPFATMSYVEGRDHSADERIRLSPGGSITNFVSASEEPLPGIAPLASRLGVRVHDSGEQPRWAVEFSARVVDTQDRAATSLREQPSSGFTTFDLRSYLKATDNLLLVAGVENLTDKHYREHLDLLTGSGVFQPGINFYFSAELRY